MSSSFETAAWSSRPESRELEPGREPPADRSRLVGEELEGGFPRVYLTRDVLAFIEAAARRAPEGATAGFLMGRAQRNEDGQPFTVIEGALEAPEVEVATRSVKLTTRAWQSLRAVTADHFRGHEVVGWFHARSGEPMTLSPYETFVHQTHFGAPGQIALILDPASGEHTFWAWKDETLARLPGFRLLDARPVGLMSAAEILRAGLFDSPAPVPSQAAAATEPVAAGRPWERGTWPAVRVQALTAARRSQRAAAQVGHWRTVARVLQGATVLVLVFVAAMFTRWGVERIWPGLTTGGGASPEGTTLSTPAGSPGGAGAGTAMPAPPRTAGSASESPGTAIMGGGPEGLIRRPEPGAPAAGGAVSSPLGSTAGRSGASGTQGGPAGALPPAAAAVPGVPAGGLPTSDSSSYAVQPGDTLWAISERFYGDPHRFRWLAEVNRLGDPGLLKPGQVLVLPPAGAAAPERK